jgi:hypothetical protein
MKTLTVALLCLASVAYPCPKGSEPYQDTCVYDIQPETAPPVKPSEEKPPKDKMPSYEREGVHVLMPQSLVEEDRKQDEDKSNADAQGKRAAGLSL